MEPELTPARAASETYKWDRLRGAGQGIVETCWQVFALLVAIRVFHAQDSVKQFIPAGLGLGLLLSPLGLSIANRLPLRVASVVSALWVMVGLALASMMLVDSVAAFVACVALAQVMASQATPMLTHLYSANYPASERGSRLSTTFVIASLCGIGFGYAGGRLLDADPGYYRLVFGAGVAAALLSAWAARRMPSETAATLETRDPFNSLAVAWQDRLYRKMLAGWMFMGMGNLMLIPVRVEYLANPLYGINASNAQVSALLVSTVLAFRLLSTKVWGALFDRVNVVVLRLCVNATFVASILLFFFSGNLLLIGAGCALLGMAFGGGGILWALYVTKVAPPDRVAAYMSVHSFTTGFRMALAPFLGYAVLRFAHPALAAWIALAMIGISTVIFMPLRRQIAAQAGEAPRPVSVRNDPA